MEETVPAHLGIDVPCTLHDFSMYGANSHPHAHVMEVEGKQPRSSTHRG